MKKLMYPFALSFLLLCISCGDDSKVVEEPVQAASHDSEITAPVKVPATDTAKAIK